MALEILTVLVTGHGETDVHLYAAVVSDPALSDILRHAFYECLTNNKSSEEVKKNILELLRCSIIHSSPNFGLFMLGVDKKIDFQNPGIYLSLSNY